MPFPNFEGKHAQDALVSPREFLDYLHREGFYPEFAMPERVVMCYQESLFRYILASEDVEPLPLTKYGLHVLRSAGGEVAVAGRFGIGAPMATIVLEELIAFGAKAFLSIGIAGSLQPASAIGEVVVCESGVRDEGVSHHYLAPSRLSYPSRRLTDALKGSLAEANVAFAAGPTWTCDAFYRETVAEALHYRDQGVLTVEMEAAALFAVAEFRGIDLGAAFVISDSMAGEVWAPQFRAPEIQEGLRALYRASVAALKGLA